MEFLNSFRGLNYASGINPADAFFEAVGVDGAFAEFGSIGVYGGDGAAEEVGDLGVVGDAYADEGEHAQLRVELVGRLAFQLLAGDEQFVDARREVGIDVEDGLVELEIEILHGGIDEFRRFELLGYLGVESALVGEHFERIMVFLKDADCGGA